MSIEFLKFIVPAGDGGLAVRLLIDNKTVTCRISQECLEDIHPIHAQSSPLEQLEVNKARLLTIAERKIKAGHIHDGVLRIYTSDL